MAILRVPSFTTLVFQLFLAITTVNGSVTSYNSTSTQTGVSFKPPNSPTGITCQYPTLRDWEACNDATDRGCWLRSTQDNSSFDIFTDYEAYWPTGVTREYHLEVTEQALSPDGYVKPLGLVMNGVYPAPVIEACWGDDLVIHVTNRLSRNGTTIHYHGIRQLNTTQYDGVNAVTQCAIAQNSTYTYRWKATQYGNTWFHSHYSLQYADGLAGPILLHGPHSASWDVAWDQIMISDWVHRSAFQDFQVSLELGIPIAQSILVNGTGRYQCSGTLPNSTTPDPYCCSASSNPSSDCCGGDPNDSRCKNFGAVFQGVFTKGKKHLLRLINSSTAGMYIFSIDGHRLRVISADLVPIQPYETESLFIGIGQRYEVIVDGTPQYEAPGGNYWMRTKLATNCGLVEQNSSTTGIIRYNASSTADPQTHAQHNRHLCQEEPLDRLVPVVPWQIDPVPANAADPRASKFEAALSLPVPMNMTHGYIRWSLDSMPFWLDFDYPTILGLSNKTYRPEQAVVPYDYSSGFVYVLATSQELAKYQSTKTFYPRAAVAPHPMHLHGHDFAILAQAPGTKYNVSQGLPKLKLTNPPRRDTSLLDSEGVLVLAFRPDNPGIWLFHCHIAWHVSSGLGFQVVERADSILSTIGSLDAVDESCKAWRDWDLQYDQNDSGV